MFMYDRQITISAAGSRKATQWPSQSLWWSELVEKLKNPARGTETLSEYIGMKKSQQDNLKDVGGFVAGTLLRNRRKASNVTGRDIITLDLDNIIAGGTQDALRRIDSLGCGYAVYSTRKHEEAKPRLRVLVPLSRAATADEYEPLSRKLASLIGMELCDPTTFEASRLMYWPSCCRDSQYVYLYGDKPFLDADGLLAMYRDWRNVNEWPEVPSTQQTHVKLAAKQGDPTAKTGIVGAFCKTYDIYRAIDTFIPDAYTHCDDSPGRLTYTGGSTVGGAVIYDNGNFLFSHHATDPASGKLCNSFDLVRLHRFSPMDDEAKPDTPTNKLPSFSAMCELAVADSYVAALMNQERYEKATEEFNSPVTTDEETSNWISKLQVSPTTGLPAKTSKNIELLMELDPHLKGRIRLNKFANRLMGYAPLPWPGRDDNDKVFEWAEADDAGLRSYIEKTLQFRNKDMINDTLLAVATRHAFDPLIDYLRSLEWDGVLRLDTLFIDYFGAEDCPYIRAATRKVFVAAVKRAMEPGCKFDIMTVIHGPQGIGKSTLLNKMGRGWFTDSLNTVEGKDAAELLQGVWIIELGELGAYSKSDIRQVKLFLSKQDDQFRAAYARRTEKHLRRCVFFGTTNDIEYLRDPSGNRRFWPVTAGYSKPTKSVFNDLDDYEIDQIWAEAVTRWWLGESVFLSKELEEEAEKYREGHTERDPLRGQIEAFIEKLVPADWQNWTTEKRRMFWNGMTGNDIQLVSRDRVCALEVWRECIGDCRVNMPKYESTRINAILSVLPEWESVSLIRFGPEYGRQRGYKRTTNTG